MCCSSPGSRSCAGSRGPRPSPLIGAAIVLLGTTTGGSVNPARQFGPAVVSGRVGFLWVYLVAPMLGAVLAATVRDRVARCRAVLTHRLCGTRADGSPLRGGLPR
ncbi:aquaporin [Peterkaempfera bronchialis]|uniref:aquaporin n=1 Tax=Peterkaempfera bronchialis TaxID=2126346 RepID=UPI003C2B6E35